MGRVDQGPLGYGDGGEVVFVCREGGRAEVAVGIGEGVDEEDELDQG